MSKVIKSEILKYFSGKFIYVLCIITTALPLLYYGFGYIVARINPEQAEQVLEGVANVSFQEYVFTSLIRFFSSGDIYLMIPILIAIIVTEDYGQGTIKYSLLAVSKEKLIMGKIVVIALVNSLLIACYLVSNIIIGFIGTQGFGNESFLMKTIVVLGIGWITILGYSSVITLVAINTRKVAYAILGGFGVFIFISMLKGLIPETIRYIVISSNIEGLIKMDIQTGVRALCVSIAYSLVFILLSRATFLRKEIYT
ncbi:ABC transporter permease [Pseudoclostridium thermosuccinogenes]|uniref:ABC transporter permease n=1 Tax=Clostridium thermosuccinogenes TaxID=84032 RepID=UPI002FDA1691